MVIQNVKVHKNTTMNQWERKSKILSKIVNKSQSRSPLFKGVDNTQTSSKITRK